MEVLMLVLNFLVAHYGLLGALAVAVLDLLMALAPGLQSNGLLHWVYLLLKGGPKALE